MIASLLAELVFIATIQNVDCDEDAAEALAETVVDAILRRRPYVAYEDSEHSGTVVKGWAIEGRFFPVRVISSEHDTSFDALRRELINTLPCDACVARCVTAAGLDLCCWDWGMPAPLEYALH